MTPDDFFNFDDTTPEQITYRSSIEGFIAEFSAKPTNRLVFLMERTQYSKEYQLLANEHLSFQISCKENVPVKLAKLIMSAVPFNTFDYFPNFFWDEANQAADVVTDATKHRATVHKVRKWIIPAAKMYSLYRAYQIDQILATL